MPVADLELSTVRTRGRAPKAVAVEYVRDLGEADLALLASGRGSTAAPVKHLRDRHHALARCLAQGMPEAEAAAVTGYSLSRISILKADASFKELCSHYRKVETSLMAEFQDRATQLTLTAMDVIAERLEDSPEEITTGQALEIVKTLADRTGHAPVQRNVNVTANLDLGSRLEAARQRLRLVQAVQEVPPGPALPIGAPEVSSPVPPE